MFIHHDGSAFNTLNEKFKHVLEADLLQKWNENIKFEKKIVVDQTTLSTLIKKFGRPYFIKIDVEGYELEVIKGLNQSIPYLSLECLFPDFAEELQQSLLLLKGLDPEVRFNIAVHEKLIFPEFKTYEVIQEFLKHYDQTHLS